MIRLKKDLTGLDCKVSERAIEYNGSISINSKKEISKMFRFLFAGVLAISALLFQSCGGGIDENAPLIKHQQNGKWGFITFDSFEKLRAGKFKVVIKHQYDNVDDFGRDGFARVQQNGKWGIINRAGKVVLPIQYDQMELSFSQGMMKVQKDGKWGFVDAAGKEIVPVKFERLGAFGGYGLPFSDFAPAKLGGKWGYIDKTGNVVIPFEYEAEGQGFWEGLAPVKLGGKWGYVNESNEVVIPFQFLTATGFSPKTGLAQVSVPGLAGLPVPRRIDKEGNIVVETRKGNIWQ